VAACDEDWRDQAVAATPEITPAAAPQDALCTDPATTYEDVTQLGPDPAHHRALGDLQETSHVDAKLTLESFTLREATLVKSPLLPYLAMLASLIEGRTIRADELLGLLLRSMRQRSFDRLPRREYVLRFLKQHPP